MLTWTNTQACMHTLFIDLSCMNFYMHKKKCYFYAITWFVSSGYYSNYYPFNGKRGLEDSWIMKVTLISFLGHL